MAGVCRAQGDLHGALDLLNQAERLYIRGFSPEVRPIPALKARVWVALGRLDEALGWARESDLSVEDDLSYLREFEHITLAKVLLARTDSHQQDLRQARCEQPSGSGPPGPATRPDATNPRPLTAGARVDGS